MSEQKHSKGAWRAGFIDRPSDDKIAISSDDADANHGFVIAQMDGSDAEANAKLICRAVNAHDELVDALEECLLMMDSKDVPAIARAALAKAAGEGDGG